MDNVNHPKHYEECCSFECIDAMRVAFGIEYVIHFCLLNAFKYMWRHKYKNGEEDLKKAEWYLNYINNLNLPFDHVDICKANALTSILEKMKKNVK